jgi:hypothetical protein
MYAKTEKMKFLIALFIPVLFLISNNHTDIKIEGFHDLEIGTPKSKVKKLLKKKRLEAYFFRTEGESDESGYPAEDEETPDEYKTWVYEVKLKKKYKKIGGIPIKAIEVQFDDEDKISNILIMIDKSDEDRILDLYGAFLMNLGETFCSSGANGLPTYYCMWDNGVSKVNIYDWNGIGESTFTEFLWVEYKNLRRRK